VGVDSPFTRAGFTIATATASAFPSKGVGDPAARLAVRELSMLPLGPSGEIGGGVAIPIHGQ